MTVKPRVHNSGLRMSTLHNGGAGPGAAGDPPGLHHSWDAVSMEILWWIHSEWNDAGQNHLIFAMFWVPENQKRIINRHMEILITSP